MTPKYLARKSREAKTVTATPGLSFIVYDNRPESFVRESHAAIQRAELDRNELSRTELVRGH